MDLYNKLVRNWEGKTAPIEEPKEYLKKGKRPLKMPKDYDFKVRNVNWGEYKNDFLLRTDAVWEKTKLKDHFYAMYRVFVYNEKTNGYYISDIRVVPTPSATADHLLGFVPFRGFTPTDGLIWTVKNGPMLFGTPGFSHFVCDKEGWYSCFIAFQKFMKCNERSEVALEEAHMFSGGFYEYPCYESVNALFYDCGPDLFEQMYEMYRQRLMGTTDKAPSYARLQLFKDPLNTVSDRKQLHY
eukprot:CAMPEP_0168336882 /NCGR_PEP_ID=MMETSP0213-20121227/11825_1 /TAXON_ID=151035 /ORGANISM="Euplotes harpa, Strain FSP1.4" /LENGTH=240 /DNA_ID=CAMNT_0008342197 /DNA_START=23 /DNA_END=745 /DNA_ORIENTATION=+